MLAHRSWVVWTCFERHKTTCWSTWVVGVQKESTRQARYVSCVCVAACGRVCVAGDANQAYTALLQRILSAGQENDMLYFVTSGSCRESVVTTQQEVAAKQARLKALAKDVHRKAPLYVPPPHPTRANTLKEQLAARGRSSLAGPSGVERASYTQLVPMYVPASPLAPALV